MSVRVSALVWQASQHASTPLLMLLAIADFADDAGKAYPAVGTLAAKCRTSPRQAIRVITELEESGELEVSKNAGPKGVNLYRVVVERLTSATPLTPATPLTSRVEGGDIQGRGGDIQGQKPLTRVSPEPSRNRHKNRQEPSVKGARALPAPAELFPEVDQQVLSQWVRVRLDKGAKTLTEIAADGLRREAGKLGIGVEQAIRLCIEHNWRSINANWPNAQAAAGVKTAWEQDRDAVAAYAGPAAAKRTQLHGIDYSAGVGAAKVQAADAEVMRRLTGDAQGVIDA